MSGLVYIMIILEKIIKSISAKIETMYKKFVCAWIEKPEVKVFINRVRVNLFTIIFKKSKNSKLICCLTFLQSLAF